MISLDRPPRPIRKSIPEVRARRPGIDQWVGKRLDHLESLGRLEVSRGRVNRRHYYTRLGLDYNAALYLGVGSQHFDRHDRLLAEAGVPTRLHADLPGRITKFLEQRHAEGTLEFKGRGRGVSQRWVAAELGFPWAVFTTHREAAEAVEAFNRRIDDEQPAGQRGKYNDLHLEIEKFLAEGWKAGTLVLGRDGVKREWLADQFGVHTPIFVRYPETQRVVEEFNARIADQLPASRAYPTLAVDLKELVAELTLKGELPVFKDRLNEAGLARRLGVTRDVFALVPECLDILAAANHAVRFEDPIRPFHHEHGRNYAFGDLATPYGPAGAAMLAKRFCDVAGPAKATAKSQYRLVLGLLARLAELLPAKAVGDIARGDVADGRAVEVALRQWRSEHLAGTGQPHILAGDVTTVRAVVDRMRLFGEASEVLVGLRNAGSSRPKQSLAEATVRCGERIAEIVSTYAATRNLDYDPKEVEAFVSNLALSGDLADVKVEDLPDAIRKLNRERLDRILACAHLTFQQGVEKHARGMELRERGECLTAELDGLLADVAAGRRMKKDLIAFFGEGGENGLAAFLHHVDRDHGGIVPRGTKGKSTADKVLHARMVQALGGADRLEGLLHLSEDAVAAACLVYIVEAGANGSVGRSLLVDCLRSSTVPGHREVEGWKDRGAKPIVTDLPVDHRDGSPSAIRVLEAMRDAHPCLARHVSVDERQHLFLADTVGRVKPIAEHRLLHLLREITRDDPSLAGFDLRVDMIRSSVLLDAALSADGNISVANAVANHSREDMTAHYVLKMPLRIIYERKIREFIDSMEAVLVDGVDGAAERLGLSLDRLKAVLAKAMRTGLGRLCLKPTDGIQPGTTPGEVCTKVQNCGSCSAAVVIAELELVTDLVIWHGSLVEAAETWPPEREEHFAATWLEELAFCDVALDALGRGPHVRVLRQARAAAERRLADPNYERPRPW